MDPIKTHFTVPMRSISGISFGSDSSQILITSLDGGMQLYGVEKQGRPSCFLAPDFQSVGGFVSSGGNRVFGASTDGRIAVWNILREKPEKVAHVHSMRVNGVDSWNQSEYFVTGSNDKSAKIHNFNLKLVATKTGHNSQVTSVCCGKDGTSLITGTAAGSVFFWDVREDGATFELPLSPNGRSEVLKIDSAADGNMFCAINNAGHLFLVDIREPENPLVDEPFKVAPPAAAFHPRQMFLLVTDTTGFPCIMNAITKEKRYSYEMTNTRGRVCANAWSPDGNLFTTAADDGVVVVWNRPRQKKAVQKPEQTNQLVYEQTESITITPERIPSVNMTPEVLAYKAIFLTSHAMELEEHISNLGRRLSGIASEYPTFGNTEEYEC